MTPSHDERTATFQLVQTQVVSWISYTNTSPLVVVTVEGHLLIIADGNIHIMLQ